MGDIVAVGSNGRLLDGSRLFSRRQVPTARGLFVTGTDTGVGKTWVSCALLSALAARGRRVIGMKPVASGCQATPQGLRSEDALALQAAANVTASYTEVNPYAFAPAIAPHIAAQEAGVAIDFARIGTAAAKLAGRADWLIIEGVGGWRVPLGPDGDVAALALMLRYPVLLVVGLRLGCINHALLSVEAIESSGLPLVGWVGNPIEAEMARREENLATLRASIPAPCLGVLPWLPVCQPEQLAAGLTLELLLRSGAS